MTGYLKHLIILLVTVALIALFLRQADLSAVGRELAHAHPGGVLLALLASVATFVFRTFRWQYLLLPSGRVPFGPAFRATVIGFGANALLPGRVGEVLRPYLLARKVASRPDGDLCHDRARARARHHHAAGAVCPQRGIAGHAVRCH